MKSFVTLENVFVTFDESLMNKSMNFFFTVLLFLLYIEYMYILITPNVWALVSSPSYISKARTHRLEGSWWRRSVRTKPAGRWGSRQQTSSICAERLTHYSWQNRSSWMPKAHTDTFSECFIFSRSAVWLLLPLLLTADTTQRGYYSN